jgi:hypothetical protein
MIEERPVLATNLFHKYVGFAAVCERMVKRWYGNGGVLCNKPKRICFSDGPESPNLIQRLKKNMGLPGCAKSLPRHLWVASFLTTSVRSRSACVLNGDSRSRLSILAMSIGWKSSRLRDGAGMIAREGMDVVYRMLRAVRSSSRVFGSYRRMPNEFACCSVRFDS